MSKKKLPHDYQTHNQDLELLTLDLIHKIKIPSDQDSYETPKHIHSPVFSPKNSTFDNQTPLSEEA